MQSKFKRWIVAALPLAMVCSVSAQGKVTDVSTRPIDGGVAIHIGGTDLAKPSTKWDGGALLLKFDASMSGKGKTWKPNTGGIKSVSYNQSGKSVWVSIRPNKSGEPQLVKVNDGWLLFFEETIADYAPLVQPKVTQNYAPVNPRDFKSRALVTLNFVDTDIVQILKALAIQANVNVAMGPDVTGKVTVNLENVPVEDAMDMVTTLGGVRYAYLNNTYIVASNMKFADTMENISHRSALVSETRVVPLFSREGTQVKAAVLKMVPPSTVDGKYELVLPSEKVSVEQTQSITPSGGKDDKGGSTQTDTKVEQKSSDDEKKKDDYIVMVGTPSRMKDVESAIRALDGQICGALGIKMGDSQAMIRRSFDPKGVSAEELVKALAGDKKNEFNGVQLVATPSASSSRQSVVLSGRESDVDRVLAVLADLDASPDQADTQYEMVDLKYIKPNFAEVQVLQNVPGIRATLLPPPVDPKVGIDYSESANQGTAASTGTGEGNAQGNQAQGAQSGGAAAGPAAGGAAAAGGAGAAGAAGAGGQGTGGIGSNGQVNTAVQTSTKSNSIPMKLLLRGTRDQIDAAKRFIAMVDIAPKQVAIELRVMELSHEDALKVGLDWSVLTGGTLRSIRINQGLGDPSVAGGVGADLGFKGGGSASIIGALDALSTKNNVLARPSILANDGVPTNIFVGDEVRYVKSILTSANNPPTITTDEVDVGVDFTVCARVGSNGNIVVDLSPTLKVLQGFTPVPGGGQLPQTSRRSAQTQMMVHSGETIAIGGLIQEQDRKTHGGIPILKDLPIVGHLFGRTTTSKMRSEVVFFVTVREVTDADRAGAANPRQAERDNTQLPGNGGKKG